MTELSLCTLHHLAGIFEFCRRSNPTLPAHVQYGPECPGAGTATATDRSPSATPRKLLMFQAMTQRSSGVEGQGLSFSTASLPESVEHVAVWLRFP